jgi:FkbM family methyltransferase
MIADLIYDVGMNNGDDTAYYLFKGFRVVAVEADPTLIEKARERFADDIRRGQLELVNVAIGPKEETASFWICDSRSEWNSFDRRIASREGLPHHAIDVQCRPFRSLLEQFGVPSYLKIDIEGHDHYCVADLDPRDLPKYVSLEMGELGPLFVLRDLGYNGFKLITQNDHSQLAVDLFSVTELVKRQLRPYPTLYRMGGRVAGVSRQLALSSKNRPSLTRPTPGGSNGNHWRFPLGSSGPFGDDTDGAWQTFDDVAYTWVTYQLGRSRYGAPRLGVWHDVHATRTEAK